MERLNHFLNIETLSREAPLDSSFACRTPDAVKRHFQRAKYGDFHLADAIRPSFDLQVVPQEGFRLENHFDVLLQEEFQILRAAVSAGRLMDVFYELLSSLGPTVNVILESTHCIPLSCDGPRPEKEVSVATEFYYREEIDLPVFKSVLMEYEEFFLADGCAGLAVSHPEDFLEVHLDEHKLIIVRANDTKPFLSAFHRYSVPRNDLLKVITDGEYVHVTRDRFHETFLRLADALNMEPQ